MVFQAAEAVEASKSLLIQGSSRRFAAVRDSIAAVHDVEVGITGSFPGMEERHSRAASPASRLVVKP
jgi:hypothetical protein